MASPADPSGAPVNAAAGSVLIAGSRNRSDRSRRGPGGLAGVVPVMVLAIVLLALIVPLLPLQDPITPDYDHIAISPQPGHLLGTDLHGRDQLSRVLWASRTSLLVGVVATALALATGIVVGGASVYGGRWIDSVLMRIADIFLSFPVILGAIAIMAVLGPGRRNVFLAIALFGWPVFARVFRASVLSVREKGFVKAARVLGASDWRIFTSHVLPNSLGPLVSYSALAVAGAILAEAGLSFIGLGVQKPYPSWGLMLSESMGQFEQAPWLVIVPGVAITFTVLTFMLLGDVIASRFDLCRAGGSN